MSHSASSMYPFLRYVHVDIGVGLLDDLKAAAVDKALPGRICLDRLDKGRKGCSIVGGGFLA